MSEIRKALGLLTQSEELGLLDLADDDLGNWRAGVPEHTESMRLWIEAIGAVDRGEYAQAMAPLNALKRLAGEDGETSQIDEAIEIVKGRSE